MKWEDNGIILSFKDFSENKSIVNVLTEQNGLHKGVIRKSSKELAKIQLGNVVFVRWNARLSDHIGTYMIEVTDIPYARIMQSQQKLLALSWGCNLLDIALPERHPYTILYATFLTFLKRLHLPDESWKRDLLHLELLCLQELGFGLNWSACALCGCQEHLSYISPKTGRSSCKSCGEPYAAKLLPMPDLLQDDTAPLTSQNLTAAFDITSFFLKNIIPEKIQKNEQYLQIRHQLMALL